MIHLTRLNGSDFYLNPALIELIEESPDTHITLSNGNRYLVLEPARVVIDRMISVQASVMRRSQSLGTRKYLKRRNMEHYRPSCLLDRE